MARGRKPSVRFFATKKGYFGQVQGERVRLHSCDADDSPAGPNYCQAVKRWISLTELSRGKGTEEYTLRAVANSYRIFLAKEERASALKIFGRMHTFVDLHGDKRVCDLKAFHFIEWMQERKDTMGWKPNTIRTITDSFQTSMNWAVKRDLIPSNPFHRKISSPRSQGRGREAVLTADLMDLMVRHARGTHASMLRVMRGTGARPEEIEMAQVSNYDNGRITFKWNAKTGYIHKQARRGMQRDRTIFLTRELQSVVESAIGDRTEGPIFTTTKGKQWTQQHRKDHLRRLMLRPEIVAQCRKDGIDGEKVVPYHFRHSFITSMLNKGMSIKLLADAVGTSVAMIEATYSHTDHDDLHALMNKFS